MLKKALFYSVLVLFSVVFLLVQYQCSNNQPEKKEMTKEEMVQRGEYLVNTGG